MPAMDYTVYEDGTCFGTLPNGDEDIFESEAEYEDAYYDMCYTLQNSCEIEWPEDWIA